MIDVTYQRFDEVLRSFGFLVRDPGVDTRVYSHPPTGAVFIMPIFPPEERVHMHHLVGARMTVDAHGVASEEEFEARLRQAG